MTSITPQYAVIFDLDGVLIDTVTLSWQAYNQVLADYGIHISDEDIKRYVGRPLQDQIRTLNARYRTHIDLPEFKARTAAIERPLFTGLRPKPGAQALLESLRDENVPCAVGTSSPRRLAAERLTTAGLTAFFSAVVAEEDVAAHKPSPEVFLKAAAQIGETAAHCLVFEDAPAGVEAAKAAGMKCCAITNHFAAAADLAQADLTITSLTHIAVPQIRELLGVK